MKYPLVLLMRPHAGRIRETLCGTEELTWPPEPAEYRLRATPSLPPETEKEESDSNDIVNSLFIGGECREHSFWHG